MGFVIAAAIVITFVRHPSAVVATLSQPGRSMRSVATWQVSLSNESATAAIVDHSAILAAAARCTTPISADLARDVIARRQATNRAVRAWRTISIIADASALLIPTAQASGLIDAGRAAPWLAGGVVAADVLLRLARSNNPNEPLAPGKWVTDGRTESLDPGRTVTLLMFGGSSPMRFRHVVRTDASFEVGGSITDPWKGRCD